MSEGNLARGSMHGTTNREDGFGIITNKARHADDTHVEVDSGSRFVEASTSEGNLLAFNADGLCAIKLTGLPRPSEIEKLIESYVVNVELLPYSLKIILLNISELVHLNAPSRRVFSGLLVEASHHYGGEVELVIAAGPPMIRKYTEIFCRALKFGDKIQSFDSIDNAMSWINKRLGDE